MAMLVTVQQVRDAVTADITDWSDARIGAMIDAASTAANMYTRRQFNQSTGARRYFVEEGGVVFTADIRSADTVTVDPDGADPVVASSVMLLPLGRDEAAFPASAVKVTDAVAGTVVEIDGEWGFPAVPADVVEAVIDTVDTWIGALPAGGRGDDTQAPPTVPGGLSVRATRLLAKYRRVLVA